MSRNRKQCTVLQWNSLREGLPSTVVARYQITCIYPTPALFQRTGCFYEMVADHTARFTTYIEKFGDAWIEFFWHLLSDPYWASYACLGMSQTTLIPAPINCTFRLPLLVCLKRAHASIAFTMMLRTFVVHWILDQLHSHCGANFHEICITSDPLRCILRVSMATALLPSKENVCRGVSMLTSVASKYVYGRRLYGFLSALERGKPRKIS